MKKHLILLVSLLVSLLAAPVVPAYNGFPLSSTPLRPAGEGSDPFGPAVPPPVISGDPIYSPSGEMMSFTDPVTLDFINAWIMVELGNVRISFESATCIYSISLRNLSTGRGYTEYYYNGALMSSVGFSAPTSNGVWEIAIHLSHGRCYYGKIVISNEAYGPLVPIDWFDDCNMGF
ncbi:MAG: hypothetical protein J6W98_04520 [Bacteroidales bacterium]|nr:hypothetical protein [Bacteroidales bacterium]